MSKLNIGDRVTIRSGGHQQDGQAGTVVYESRQWGTIGVDVSGRTFGFFPGELTKAES